MLGSSSLSPRSSIQTDDKAHQLLRIGGTDSGSCPFSQGPSYLYSLLLYIHLLSDFPTIGFRDAFREGSPSEMLVSPGMQRVSSYKKSLNHIHVQNH